MEKPTAQRTWSTPRLQRLDSLPATAGGMNPTPAYETGGGSFHVNMSFGAYMISDMGTMTATYNAAAGPS